MHDCNTIFLYNLWRQVCNGNKYLNIHPVDMQQAWIQHSGVSRLPADFVPLPTCTVPDRFDRINTDTLRLDNGARVRLEKIPLAMFRKVEVFYVCDNCGKVYWEGGHYEKVHEKFSYVLSTDRNNVL